MDFKNRFKIIFLAIAYKEKNVYLRQHKNNFSECEGLEFISHNSPVRIVNFIIFTIKLYCPAPYLLKLITSVTICAMLMQYRLYYNRVYNDNFTLILDQKWQYYLGNAEFSDTELFSRHLVVTSRLC